VDNSADFIAAMENEAFDLILADYKLPSWNGIQALARGPARRGLKYVPAGFRYDWGAGSNRES